MSKPPPIPSDQRNTHGHGVDIGGEHASRHDAKTGLQSAKTDDSDTNLDEQGRQGNLKQNVSAMHHQVPRR